MRGVLLVLLVLLAGVCVSLSYFAEAAPSHPTVTNATFDSSLYNLRWSDDFEGDAINTTIWFVQEGPWKGGLSTKQNVLVSDGQLHLVQNRNSTTGNYTQGRVNTLGFFGTGYFETRLRTGVGGGWHQGWYLAGLNFYAPPYLNGELDVVELNTRNPSYWTATSQLWSDGTQYQRRSRSILLWKRNFSVYNTSADFNTWGFLWTKERTQIYYNGEIFIDLPYPPTRWIDPVQMLLTTVIYPESRYPFDPHSLGSELTVDYVAYYTLDSEITKPFCV